MYDKEKLGKIFSDIDRYLNDLKSFGITDQEDLGDKKTFYAVSMTVFSAINRAIDLGEEVIAANNLGTPGTFKDIFFMLMKGGFISRKMKEQLSDLSSYRNLFSHEYFTFTVEDVFKAFCEISVIEDFANQMRKRIKA